MANQMVHRGPDDCGFYSHGPVAFGFRRLSIIDIEGGHQPISNEDEMIWCMLNGEIYNYVETRQQMEKRGHRFKTHSDTETIVHQYEEHGVDFLDRLRGMFAIALWDKRNRRLVLARDRIGKKPLYYAINGGQLAFASELKALIQWPGLGRDLDLTAFEDYLRFLYVPGPKSIFKSARKLLPGEMLIADAGCGWRIQRYWSFHISPDADQKLPAFVDGLRDRLREAVRVRLRSDVPLGAFLSGGVDSSTVAALMCDAGLGSPPLTFSMAFPAGDFDESHYARLVAAHLGTNHHEELAEAVSPEILEEIVWHLDEPFGDSSSVPTYLVCQAARKHVIVALSGDGADEIFAGYDRYRFYRWIAILDRCPLSIRRWIKGSLRNRRKAVAALSDRLSEQLRQSIKAVEASLIPESERPFFLNQYFDPAAISKLLTPDVTTLNGHMMEDEWCKAFPFDRIADGLDVFLYIDTAIGLPDDMLTKVDRMSMANSLEVRCPFLDQEVVEYAGRIPHRFKLHGGQQKYALKRAVADLLPLEILRRGKKGFSAPIGLWLQTTFRELVVDCLSPETVRRRGLMIPAQVAAVRDTVLGQRTLAADDLSQHQRWHRLWALLMFEMWARQYLDS